MKSRGCIFIILIDPILKIPSRGKWLWSVKGNSASITADTHRRKIGVLGTVEFVKAHARAGRVDLQVEDGGLDRFLILVAQFGQTVNKGVGDAEFLATSYSCPCEEPRRGRQHRPCAFPGSSLLLQEDCFARVYARSQ